MIITNFLFFSHQLPIIKAQQTEKTLQTVWSTREAQSASWCTYFHNKYI